jgi:hypothetical protein
MEFNGAVALVTGDNRVALGFRGHAGDSKSAARADRALCFHLAAEEGR